MTKIFKFILYSLMLGATALGITTFLLMLLASQAHADQVKIAIIDTGYSKEFTTYDLKLCPSGHYDFYKNEPKVGMTTGPHGSHVGSVIAAELTDVDYCALIYQVGTAEGITLPNIIRAIEKASDAGAVAINISIVGPAHLFAEKKVLQRASNKGIAIFAAAGNENSNLDSTCNSYPGCYQIKNLYLVGAISPDGTQKAVYSNYGSLIHLWYPGHFQSKYGVVQGTSFAAPRALSDYVRNLKP
jgi:serine protease